MIRSQSLFRPGPSHPSTMAGNREEHGQAPVPSLGESSTEALQQATGCRLAQLQSTCAAVPAEHRTQSFLGRALIGCGGELLRSAREDLQFETGSCRLQRELKGAACRETSAAAIDQASKHRFEPARIAQNRRQASVKVEIQVKATTLQLLVPTWRQETQHRTEVSAGKG